jgi:hypothetical protein
MFRIVNCVLNVENSRATATITLSGSGFGTLYMGTGGQALADPANHIGFAEDSEGRHVYTIPVSALEAELDCAGLSIRKQEWYDHTIIVHAPSGIEYTANATLTGGAGKATVESPCKVKLIDGKFIATLVWSSKNYDYMIVGGKKYLQTTTEPASTFEIPVTPGEDMRVIADTTAMSEPHEIEYMLRLDLVNE